MALNLNLEYKLPPKQEKAGKLANAVIREIYYDGTFPLHSNFSAWSTAGYCFYHKKKLIFIPIEFIPYEVAHKIRFDGTKDDIYSIKMRRASYDKEEFKRQYCCTPHEYRHILSDNGLSIFIDRDYNSAWFLTPYTYGDETIYMATGNSLSVPSSFPTSDKILINKLNNGVKYIDGEVERLFSVFLDRLEEDLSFEICFSGVWRCNFYQEINLMKTTIKDIIKAHEEY